MNTVLIAHHNKDVSWINEITSDVDIKIYSTSDPTKIYVTPNKGMDANMYLRYILDNYSNLPDRTLFVHHHREDWSQDYDLPYIINNLNWKLADYFNIGARKCYGDPYVLESPARGWVTCAWQEVLGKYLPFPNKLLNYAGTQFMCHKKLILQYPKRFYADLHTWLMFTSLPDRASGRVFEYIWHYILTKDPIDKKYEINQILNL